MSDENRHTQASKELLNSTLGIDPRVSKAVRNFLALTSASYTIKSRTFSLLKQLKTQIDNAVFEWLCRNSFQPTWQFSELALLPHSSALQILEGFQRHGVEGDLRQSILFERTCSCLIELLYFCGNHPSNKVRVVRTEPDDNQSFDEDNFRFGTGIQLGTRAKESTSRGHQYLNSIRNELKADGFCISCGQKTLASEERSRLISSKSVNKSIRDALKSGVQYANKERGSLEYCFEHAEGIAGSAAAHRARYWQIRFLSLLYAMRRIGVRRELNSIFPKSFDFEFARLAMKDKKCRIHITRIKQNIDLILSDSESPDRTEAKLIVWHINKMFFEILKLKPNPDTLPILPVV